jgi:hypothetical protein
VSDAERLRATGDRIEALLDDLGALPDRRAKEWAEEVLRLVTDLYGAGLARAIEIMGGAGGSAAVLDQLAQDELVSNLLWLHGLHPLSARQRIERALAELNGSLGASDARLLAVDEEAGTARVRLLTEGSGSAKIAAEELVRRAITKAAPEIEEIEWEQRSQGAPIRLGATRHANTQDAPVEAIR